MAHNLPKDMPEVCGDTGDSIWRYDPAKDMFYRIYPDGGYTRIMARHIPNPEILFRSKIENERKRHGKFSIEALRPSPAIYSLWEYKKKLEIKSTAVI